MGWIAVNILIPLLAPIIFLLPFKLFPLPPENAKLLKWTTPIKDGQLAWAGLAFSAAAIYDLESVNSTDSWTKWMLGGIITLLVANGLVAALGGVFPKDHEPEEPSPFSFYPAMSGAAILSALAGIAFAVVHFAMQGATK